MERNWIKRGKYLIGILVFCMFLWYGAGEKELWKQAKSEALELAIRGVRFMVSQMIPQIAYQDRTNMETVYQIIKRISAYEMFPYLGYVEQYGQNGQELIAGNVVPSFLYEEDEETDKKRTETTSGGRFSKQQLYQTSFLRKQFLQVDSTTTITDQELNGKQLFDRDLTIKEDDGPQIYLYHTHGSEAYADSRLGKQADTVVGVGDELEQELKERGFSVLHDKTSYDVRNGVLDRSKAYYYAAQGIEKALKRYPKIQVIIDLHRDGVAEGTRLVTKINGKSTAKIMFFNGMSRTATNGNIAYLNNPNKLWNLSLSMQLQKQAYEDYPGLTRKIYIKGYRYNLHYRKRSMLVEVGAQTNTVKEAKRAMRPLADLLEKVLK